MGGGGGRVQINIAQKKFNIYIFSDVNIGVSYTSSTSLVATAHVIVGLIASHTS